jgi:amino acid transporter
MSKGYGPQALAVGRVGSSGMLTMAMAAAAPLTVVAGVFGTAYAVTGITALPVPIAVVAAVLGLFSVGYTRMAEHIQHPGAFYAYVAHGLGRPVACGTAWLALASYHALQVGLYGLLAFTVVDAVDGWFGVGLHWAVPALAARAVIAVLGVRRIDVNRAVTAVLLIAEVGLVVLFAASFVLDPADESLSAGSLSPTHLTDPGIGAALVLCVLAFIGFEQPAVYGEEARNSGATVRRAIKGSLLVIASLYIFVAWAIPQGTGPDNLVASATEQGPALFYNLGAERLGAWAGDAGLLMQIASAFIAALAFHNTTARYAFSLGREGILPAWLAATSQHTGAPKAGSLMQSGLAAVTIGVYALAKWDPLVHLFFYLGTSGGYGVLVLLAVTGVAVPAYFRRHPHGENAWRRSVAPITASILLIGMAILATIHLDTLLGVAPDSALRWTVPVIVVFLFVGGTLNGLLLGIFRPDTYRRIGLGSHATTIDHTRKPRHSTDTATTEISVVPAQIAEPTRMPLRVVDGVGGTSQQQRDGVR